MSELPLNPGLSTLLPSLHAVGGAFGLIVALAMCLLLGALVLGRDSDPEVQLLGGWGVLCLVLTLWGVLCSASLCIPLFALAAIALAVLCVPRLRERTSSLQGTGAILALSLPLWLVMLPVAPSQPDTWLNLLPNAAYLAAHGRFPANGLPPSYSFIPGAPYNTQFVALAASAFSGSFAESAMGLFNLALACVAGAVLARQLPGWGESRRRPLPAWAGAAVGLLLAVPFNPGFVPRYCLAPYGEWPLAVTTMLAGLIGMRLIEEMRSRGSALRHALALALVLAAEINIKQSGPGLVLAIGIAITATGWVRLHGTRRLVLLAPMLPALGLYALWQHYVARSGAAQLEVAPMSAWNVGLLPTILLAMAHEAIKHFALFALLALVLGGAVAAARNGRRDHAGLLLCIAGGTILLDNGYILASYVVHSDPVGASEAHSYFRYNTQLSLLTMLALTVWLRPSATRAFVRPSGLWRRRLGVGAVCLVLVAPLALWPLLRVDLEAPQPTLTALAANMKPFLHSTDRVALVLPGDRDDTLGGLLRGQILFMPPKASVAGFASYAGFDANSLASAGFDKALLTCAPAKWTGTSKPAAALLGRQGRNWRLLAAWRYPPSLLQEHFGSLIPRSALCAGS